MYAWKLNDTGLEDGAWKPEAQGKYWREVSIIHRALRTHSPLLRNRVGDPKFSYTTNWIMNVNFIQTKINRTS